MVGQGVIVEVRVGVGLGLERQARSRREACEQQEVARESAIAGALKIQHRVLGSLRALQQVAPGPDEAVGAGAAVEGVAARASADQVVAAAAVDEVRPAPAVQGVSEAAAIDEVIEVAADHQVRLTVARDVHGLARRRPAHIDVRGPHAVVAGR